MDDQGREQTYTVMPDDSDHLHAQWIEDARQSFEVTGNPCFAINAFGIAAHSGWYPPSWVMDFFAQKFADFESSDYDAKLNELFGFSRGPGKDAAYKEAIKQQRDEYVMRTLYELRREAGLSIEKAAKAVAVYFHDHKLPWPFDTVTKKPLAWMTLRDRYKKEKWEHYFNRDEETQASIKAIPESARAEYLAAFGVEKQPAEHSIVTDFFRKPPPVV